MNVSDTDKVRLIVLDSAHRTVSECYAEYMARRDTETLHEWEQVIHLYFLLAGCYEWAGTERICFWKRDTIINHDPTVKLKPHAVELSNGQVLDYWTEQVKRTTRPQRHKRFAKGA